MDEQRAGILGFIPRGFGYRASRDVSSLLRPSSIDQDKDKDVPRTTGTETETHHVRTGSRTATGTGTGAGSTSATAIPTTLLSGSGSGSEDHRNYHEEPKYSNKNWGHGQQQQQPSQSRSARTLSRVLVHAQPGLVEPVEAPRLLQLDPSQSHSHPSHWPPNQGRRQDQHQHQQGKQSVVVQQHSVQSVQNVQSQSQHTNPVLSSQARPHSHAAHPTNTQAQIQAQATTVTATATTTHQYYHNPHHNHQPYHHYRHASQPPRLPPLGPSLSSFASCLSSSIPTSPFDPFRSHSRDGDNNYFLSFTTSASTSSSASPTPATCDIAGSAVSRLPVQTDDLVSPISETRSSTPAFRSFDASHSPAAAPSSTFFAIPTTLKRQPTTYSSTQASLLDDKDFELSLGVTERAEPPATSPSRFPSAAVTSAVAQDVAHLTDERSDDWFKFTARESTASKHTMSLAEAHPNMTVPVTADESTVPQLQDQEQRQQQTSQYTSIPSFTPLPPIRRTSTFDVLRKKGLVDYDSDTVPSPIENENPPAPAPAPMPPGPAGPVLQPSNSSHGQLPSAQSASRSSPHNSVQPQPQQHPDLNPPGQSQPAIPQNPEGLVAAGPAGQPGVSPYPIMPTYPQQPVMGRAGPAGQQVAPGHMMLNGQGQAILSLPGGRRWTEQESHLIEPLNPSNRNRSANSPHTYTAYDKETEGERAPSQFGGGSSQPVQTRPRNLSNTSPPTAATRFPSLFPHTSVEQPPFPQNRGQVPLSQLPLMRRQNGNPGQRDSFDDRSLAKEMDVRVDQISVSSTVAEDVNDKTRRGSGSLFNLGHHRRNSSNATAAQQAPPDGTSEKKKNFFASVTGMGHSQPKPKSNLGPARTQPTDQPDQPSLQNQADHMAGKKKLSELKGMIKGVGNAKEGAKDDQPVKVETVYEPRESMQSPPHNFAVPQGVQGAPRPPVSFGPFGSQPQANNAGPQASMQPHPSQMRPSGETSSPPFMGVGRTSTSGPPPNQNPQVKGDEGGKKGTGGGFLGGLFGKQGHKTKEPKPQSPQQMPPPNQRPAQPPVQPGYLPFRPGQMQLPGQQLGPHPMLAGQPPIQRGPPGQSPSPTYFNDPTQPSPSVQTAQAVTIRRPSEITVSSSTASGNPRPGMPSPQASQSTFKQQAGHPTLIQRPSQMGLRNDGMITSPQTSPQLSDDSPLEKPAMGNLSAIPRFSPNRKPVGSGNARADGPFMTSAVSPGVMGRTGSPSPGPGQQRAPSQLSHIQQSPQLSSEPSPVPSQSNHSSSSKLPGDQFSRDFPDPRDSSPGLGLYAPPNAMNTPGPGGAPNGLTWGPNGARPSVPPLTSPSAAARAQPPRTPSSPVPSMDQSKLSKFFGAYDGGKPAAQPQANKEKSAASKFLGAFKRSSKQNEAPTSQPRPQTSPQIQQQQNFRPGGTGPSAPGGMPNAGGIPSSSIPPTQPQMQALPAGQGRGAIPPHMAVQQIQAGRGLPGQIPPQGMPMPGQAGRGQMPPGMIPQGGRGQIPPQMFPGGGPLPPHMQRPMAPGKQGNEPQYDQVPIPRGYEAVHGYGPGGMLAFSPYNAGRPSNPPIQFPQYPPGMPPGFPQRQWDPRMMQPPQAGSPPAVGPGAPQMMPQGAPNNLPYQVPQQPQMPGQTQSPPPVQGLQSAPSQGQQPPQPSHSISMQQPGRFSPPGQPQIPNQIPPGAQLQQNQPPGQGFQREPSPGAQVQQPYSWSGTPQNNQSPAASIQQPNSPTPNLASQSSVQAMSSSASNGTSTPQSQHTTATAPSQPSQPSQPLQASSTHQSSPVNQAINTSAQRTATPSNGPPEQVRSPSSATTASSGPLRSPDAVRLTSRMSVSKHAARGDAPATFGVDKPADRTLTVSPEPPGPRHGPIHQVSEQNLNVNVERANSHARYGSEDIYDATPRLDNATPRQAQGEDQAHENTKYAGSEKGRILTNGAGIGLGVAATDAAAASVTSPAAPPAARSVPVTEDNMSFLDGPDDSEPDENNATEEAPKEETAITPPQRMNMMVEPEEKILVDQPVELAAVNDDDDGLPMMSATSYPGQEWNPYGAGEFGDWE
ncbi:hypothetical protein F5Y07DRAFT_140518 [Xylaria sp. FL0933]|nr:hypothetical protein F5Y07DRAFT_140518 [Xylaria sp. FL0933]